MEAVVRVMMGAVSFIILLYKIILLHQHALRHVRQQQGHNLVEREHCMTESFAIQVITLFKISAEHLQAV